MGQTECDFEVNFCGFTQPSVEGQLHWNTSTAIDISTGTERFAFVNSSQEVKLVLPCRVFKLNFCHYDSSKLRVVHTYVHDFFVPLFKTVFFYSL